MSDNFHEKSYQKHYEHYRQFSDYGERQKHAKTWLESDTVNSWRHQRMYRVLDPIIYSGFLEK